MYMCLHNSKERAFALSILRLNCSITKQYIVLLLDCRIVDCFLETSMVEGRVKEAVEAALEVCSCMRNVR